LNHSYGSAPTIVQVLENEKGKKKA